MQLEKWNDSCRKIPNDYIKGTLVSLKVKSNRAVDVYEHLIGRKYELPKKIKRIKKKPIYINEN